MQRFGNFGAEVPEIIEGGFIPLRSRSESGAARRKRLSSRPEGPVRALTACEQYDGAMVREPLRFAVACRRGAAWNSRAGRIVLFAALGGMLFAASASGQLADQKWASVDPYWLGPFFAGLQVSEEGRSIVPEFIYGDCEPPEGEGGCSWPARVETTTTCALNPIAHETPFAPVSLLRGGGLMTEDERVYVSTGDRTFTVETREPELMSAALREARRRSQPAPEPLPPPVYPITVLRELKRVTAAAGRLRGVKAIARATELRPDQVRYRLRVAELLGPGALAGVPVPTMSTARVKRLIQLAILVRLYPTRTAEKNGMTVAELRKLVSRVRGLTGFC